MLVLTVYNLLFFFVIWKLKSKKKNAEKTVTPDYLVLLVGILKFYQSGSVYQIIKLMLTMLIFPSLFVSYLEILMKKSLHNISTEWEVTLRKNCPQFNPHQYLSTVLYVNVYVMGCYVFFSL